MILPHETPATGPAAALAADLQARLPVLRTDRLQLRAPAIEDFAAYAEIACSPRGKYLGSPVSRDDAWLDFTQLTAGWLLRGHGAWAVETETGLLAGFVLIGFEPGDLAPELGFLFRAGAEGQGIAFEAARAARDHAFDTLKLDRLVSYIDPANDRALRLAERLGGQRDGMVDEAVQFTYPRSAA